MSEKAIHPYINTSIPRLLVTGANGMLGQDLCPILEDEGYDVIETDIDNLDITNHDMIDFVLKKELPDYIIHCAAYTNVDKAEEEPEKAELINAKGTENLAKACAKNNIPTIYISTDYVFDGREANAKRNSPYNPSDIPHPINIYGQTKLKGEEMIKKYCTKYYIVRTSWLYGHHGKNFVETMISLADKPELKVVDDQIGCPTWTVELANGIIKIISEKDFGTYHVCGSGSTTWYGFAKEIFKQTGLKVNLKPCATEEFPRPAQRPRYSIMNNDNICRDWRLALKDYLKLRMED